ncbi:hypothetical protein CY34DRAFT_321081 [Suillus luteus UH-Slu-Lm8-n1]|uniref:Uncharacterized protein n=1 Tax=Suillus luteus UH-Slu-Lm8-n1 TaxID=930992 RepID=A0A0D0AZD9_9AGAM|nr:hypothetical protein CY34DRAFT_321081 [Suillus luteus UH-Slu-Lm8-n1]
MKTFITLWKWLQWMTRGQYLLLGSRNQISHALSLLILHSQVKDEYIHYPLVCWVTSRFSSAAYVIMTVIHNRHSNRKANYKIRCRPMQHHHKRSSKPNRKVKTKLTHHHHRLSLPLRHPRHLLRDHIQIHSSVACRHSSALKPKLTKKSNFPCSQAVPMLLKGL